MVWVDNVPVYLHQYALKLFPMGTETAKAAEVKLNTPRIRYHFCIAGY
jgi:hypothetical protein